MRSSISKSATRLAATCLLAPLVLAPKAWSQTYAEAVAVMNEVNEHFEYGETVCHDYAVKMVMLMEAKWPNSSYLFCAVDGIGFDGVWAHKSVTDTAPLAQSEDVKAGILTNHNGTSKWKKVDLGLDENKVAKHAKAHTWVIVRTTDFGLVQFDPTWSDNDKGLNWTSIERWSNVPAPWSDGTNRFFYTSSLEHAAVYAANLKRNNEAKLAVYWPEKDKVAIVLTEDLQRVLGYWKRYSIGSYVILE
jgi:hypothetical protein